MGQSQVWGTAPSATAGKVPNSPVLTHFWQDEKHIQLFYLESGERMCEIKIPP